jgi:putative protease
MSESPRDKAVRERAGSPKRDISSGARDFARRVKGLGAFCDIGDKPLPELLLPAGSPLSLEAAIEAGADAVYFGARSFSARQRAENFADNEIGAALRLCRAYGVRAYAAVNTRVRESEIAEAMRLVDMLANEGVDALITADLGLCANIRREFGDSLELHASTQLTPVSVYDAKALCELGFKRMVAPRELSLAQLARLCENSPIEIEAFIHGAHCVSLSGQCLMSALIGGRSANRGECAQPCRMTYSCGKENSALLSLADMCLAPDIPAVISTGVRSLKVEGRQKDAAYVYGVGRLYRRLLDERRGASADEIEELAELFERGFTDGYLRGDFRAMRGTRREDAPFAAAFGSLSRKVPLDARLTLREGEAPTLEMSAPGLSASVSLDEAAKRAEGEPTSGERAEKQIARLGGTPFELSSFSFENDGGVWLCAADLNELRRRCVERLTDPAAREKSSAPPDTDLSPTRAVRGFPRRAAEFTSLAQIPQEAFAFFDAIYLPCGEYDADARAAGVSLSLPPFMTDDVADKIAPLIRPGDRVLAHSVGQIEFVRSLGAIADCSLRLNVWNAGCAKRLCGMIEGFITVSPELPMKAAYDISDSAGGALCVAYGKLPVMYTVRCMIRECAKCKGGPGGVTGGIRESGQCRAYFEDRTKARFFVLGGRDCANTFYNSVPTWTADRPVGPCGEYFIFSDESAADAAAVIAAYKSGAAPDGKVRRVK